MSLAALWMRHGTCGDGLYRPGAHARPDSSLTIVGAVETMRTCASYTNVVAIRHLSYPVHSAALARPRPLSHVRRALNLANQSERMPLARHHDRMRICSGSGRARVRLVRVCPSIRLMPGACPAPRRVASCTTYSFDDPQAPLDLPE